MSCIFYFEGNNKFASYLVFAVLALDNCCSVAFDCNAGSLAGNQPEFISTQFHNGFKKTKTFFSSGELPEPMVPRVLGETPQVGEIMMMIFLSLNTTSMHKVMSRFCVRKLSPPPLLSIIFHFENM